RRIGSSRGSWLTPPVNAREVIDSLAALPGVRLVTTSTEGMAADAVAPQPSSLKCLESGAPNVETCYPHLLRYGASKDSQAGLRPRCSRELLRARAARAGSRSGPDRVSAA